MSPLYTALLLLLQLLAMTAARQNNENLYNFLMQDYNKNVPPEENEALEVKVAFTPTFFTVVSATKTEVTGWISQRWVDRRLSWSPEDINNSAIRIHQDDLWVPDITVYNLVGWYSWDRTLAVVFPDGSIQLVNPLTVTVPSVNTAGTRNFYLKIGSWTYDGSLLDIQADQEEVDTSELGQMENFQLSQSSLERVDTHYPCCRESYPSVVASFTLTPATA